MTQLLNTSPVVVGTTAVDLISGAALSGLAGAVAPSPKVHVKSVALLGNDPSASRSFKMYKGASGGSVSGTEVFVGRVPSNAVYNRTDIPLDIALEAGEVLTAIAGIGATPTVLAIVSAEITF